MVTSESNFPNRPFRLSMSVVYVDQNIAANTSRVSFWLGIKKNSYSPSWSNEASYFQRSVAGQFNDGYFTYDFRNSDELMLDGGYITVAHNDDGTGSLGFSGGADVAVFGVANVAGSLTLPRIPRGPRVRYGGQWRNTVAYVRSGGSWRIAIPYVRSGGSWRIGGG